MTKGQLIELAQRTLSAQLKEEFDKRIVTLWLSLAYNQMLHDTSKTMGFATEFYAKEYSSVAVSGVSGAYYAELPAQIVHLENFGSGVVNVSTKSDTHMIFLPTTKNGLRYFNGAEVGTSITDQVFYTVDYDRISFSDNLSTDIATAGVRMNLVVSFDEWDDTDNINIPGGKDYDFISLAINLMKGVPDLELKNTND